MNKPALLCLAAFISASTFTPAALADSQTQLDPNDSPGPLDIVAVRSQHERFTDVFSDGRRRQVTEIFLRLTTYEVWERNTLASPRTFLSFEFNLDNDETAERCLVIADEGGRDLTGRLYKRCTYSGDDPVVAIVSVSRRNDQHSAFTSVDRYQLRRGLDSYRWRALSSYENANEDACPASRPPEDTGLGTCLDVTTWKRHRF